MPEQPKTILESALRLTHDAEIAEAETHPGSIGFDVQKNSAEINVSGEKGRLYGAAYVKGSWGSVKDWAVGVRGRWSLRPK